jgi:heat shock protein HslJ
LDHDLMRRLLLVVALALLVAGCTDDPDVDSRTATYGLPDLEVDLAATGWSLDGDDSSVDVGDATVTLDVHDDDTASGRAPCNAYRAAVDLDDDGDTVRFTDIATSLAACDDATTAAEDAYLTALAAVRDVDLSDDGEELVLTGPGDVRLSFTEFDPYDALVGEWQVTSIRTEDAVESVPADVDARLTFTDDGTVRIENCGTVEGTYELDDDQLDVELPDAVGCPGAEGDVEAAIVSGLNGTRSVQITPHGLTLLFGDGTIALDVAEPPD